MLDIAYKREQMALQAVGCLLMAFGGAWLAFQESFHWQIRGLGGFLAICLPFVALVTANKVMSGQSAIREINGGLSLTSLYGSLEFRWEQLRSIDREVLSQESAFGLIKQNLAHYIVFVVMDPRFGEKRFKIHEDLIAVPKREMPQLYERLHQMWASGGSTMIAPSRVVAPVTPAPRAMVGFGRKGL